MTLAERLQTGYMIGEQPMREVGPTVQLQRQVAKW